MPAQDPRSQEADRLLAEAQELLRRVASLHPRHSAALHGAAARISQIRQEIANPFRLVG